MATLAARCVEAVADVTPRPPTILDTRKTTPGLRDLEKAAVAAGGATNHRTGPLRRDPHQGEPRRDRRRGRRGRAPGPRQRPGASRSRSLPTPPPPTLPLEVECRDLAEVDEALAAGAPRLLLDNMDPAQLAAAVRHVAGRAELEASGGVTLATLRAVAETGVDFISVGALTHSAPALDLSLILTVLP